MRTILAALITVILCVLISGCSTSTDVGDKTQVSDQLYKYNYTYKNPVIELLSDWTCLPNDWYLGTQCFRYISVDGVLSLQFKQSHGGSVTPFNGNPVKIKE